VASARHDKPAGLLHVPGVGEQSPDPLGQAWPVGVTQVPGVFEHVGGGLHARPLVLHVPGVGEHCAAAVHVVVGVTQLPGWELQSLFSVQGWNGETLHVPLPAVCVHCDAD